MKKLFFYSLIFITSISLSACLNVNREIKFDASGKGNEKLTVVLGSEFMSMMAALSKMDDSGKTDPYDDNKFIGDITTALKEVPGITINNVSSVIGQDSSNTLKIDYNFDNIPALASALLGKESQGDSIISYYTLGDSVYFSYIVNMNSGNAEDSSSSMNDAYKELFINDKLIVKFEFPYTVTSSNGTSISGRKVTWDMPMNDVMGKDKVILRAVMKKD
ncbi:hypothetical protein BH10BAC5_BH10BAC5_24760 [soil metagenome]